MEKTKNLQKDNDNKDPETKQENREKKLPKRGLMNTILLDSKNPINNGDLVEGSVIALDKSSVYVDLPPHGTGIIYGREFLNARDIVKNLGINDSISAKVVNSENEDGYVELSLKEARQALIWSEADDAIKNGTIFELEVKEANKGGLMLEWKGIFGFLPTSQLKEEHYPRVEDGEKDKILSELKNLIGQKLSVSMISSIPKDGKLIFSEKGPEQKEKISVAGKYEVGNEVEGEITGIVEFGVFIKIEDGLEGLAHISELDWGLVEDPKTLFKVGETVKGKIIEVKDGKISLSIKALKDNPWKNIEKKYKKEDNVEAVVIKFNKHGALASIEEGVAGLIHVSEFESEEVLREKLELGKKYKFKISVFEPEERKMVLSLVE